MPGKAVREEIVADGEKVLSFAQRLFRLVQAGRENAKAIAKLKDEVAALQDQVRTLQDNERVLLARAELAAAQAVTDLALRIGYLEGRASRD
jgi:cell division protein FtsB